eukprot:2273741-Rhodomonas_salina.1
MQAILTNAEGSATVDGFREAPEPEADLAWIASGLPPREASVMLAHLQSSTSGGGGACSRSMGPPRPAGGSGLGCSMGPPPARAASAPVAESPAGATPAPPASATPSWEALRVSEQQQMSKQRISEQQQQRVRPRSSEDGVQDERIARRESW